MENKKARQNTLEYAFQLSARGLLHAAFEQFYTYLADHENDIPPGSYEWSLVQDEIGKIQVQWGQFAEAEQSFSRAATYMENEEHRAKCLIHLATALSEQGYLDRAYRLLSELLTHAENLSSLRLGILYNNLASIQWATEFYRDAAKSMLQSLDLFHRAGTEAYNETLYLNLGTCYLEMRQFEEAEKYLKRGLQNTESELLPYTLFGLSRLYFAMGDYNQSMAYAQQAVPVVGSIPMNFARYRIAYFSRFLAEMAYRVGDRRVAIQLMEKAELFFGMLERWTLWSETQALLTEWTENKSPITPAAVVSGDGLLMVKRFLWLIDAMNAQELLSPKFPQLIDTRVQYALLLAEELGLSHEEKEDLAYAARLADYGLTALDPEVVENPRRSVQAQMQYEQHPQLSVQMLQDLILSPQTYAAIASHHARRDGSGFGPEPETGWGQGRGAGGGLLSGILQLVDEYATSVVWKGRTHSETIQDIKSHKSAYDERVFDTMMNLFKA